MSRKKSPDIAALQRFTKVLDALGERERYAAVAWLADKYLGVKLYGVRKWTRSQDAQPVTNWLFLHRFFMTHRHDMGRDTAWSRVCGWCKFMRLSAFCPIGYRSYREGRSDGR